MPNEVSDRNYSFLIRSSGFTISLAVLVLALGAYIWFFERHTLSTSELSERKRRLVQEFVRDRVTEIGIVRANERTVLKRSKDTWMLDEPFRTRADQSAIESLLSALEWTDPLRAIDRVSATQRSQFGLTKPRLRAWVMVGSQRIPITFGDKDVVEDGIYVQLTAPDRVFVVSKDFLDTFDHPAGHFRLPQDGGQPKLQSKDAALLSGPK